MSCFLFHMAIQDTKSSYAMRVWDYKINLQPYMNWNRKIISNQLSHIQPKALLLNWPSYDDFNRNVQSSNLQLLNYIHKICRWSGFLNSKLLCVFWVSCRVTYLLQLDRHQAGDAFIKQFCHTFKLSILIVKWKAEHPRI